MLKKKQMDQFPFFQRGVTRPSTTPTTAYQTCCETNKNPSLTSVVRAGPAGSDGLLWVTVCGSCEYVFRSEDGLGTGLILFVDSLFQSFHFFEED